MLGRILHYRFEGRDLGNAFYLVVEEGDAEVSVAFLRSHTTWDVKDTYGWDQPTLPIEKAEISLGSAQTTKLRAKGPELFEDQFGREYRIWDGLPKPCRYL